MRTLSHLSLVAVLAFSCVAEARAQEGADLEALGFPGETAAVPEDRTGIDWSVGLRGSYAANTVTGSRMALALTPEASLTLNGESSRTRYAGAAELVVEGGGAARVGSLEAGLEHSFSLGPATLLEGSITGAMTQPAPYASGLPANTLHAPITGEGAVQGRITQDFGRFDARLTLDGERLTRGVTTLDDLSTVDNAHQSYWQGGGTLRLSYEITPRIAAFAEGQLSARKFDAPDPGILRYMDGRTYELRAGLSYAHGSIVSAEASIGRAWLDFFDDAIPDTQSWVYNGSLTFRPDETLSLTGGVDTTLGPSATMSGDTDATYALTAEARYQANPWLTLRGSAGYDRTLTLGTGDVGWGYDLGAGLDYQGARHVVWTADYTFARDLAPPAPLSDTHTVSLGVRVQR